MTCGNKCVRSKVDCTHYVIQPTLESEDNANGLEHEESNPSQCHI